MMGLAAAKALAERGLSAVLIDRFPPHLNKFNSSHGASRLIRPTYPIQMYHDMCLDSMAMWEELSDRYGREGRRLQELQGGLEIGDGNSVQSVVDTLEATGSPYERLQGSELRDRFPQFRFGEEHEAIFCPQSGVLRADACLEALLAAAEEGGVSSRLSHTLTGLDLVGSSKRLRLGVAGRGEEEEVEVGEVVFAMGSYSSLVFCFLLSSSSSCSLSLSSEPFFQQHFHVDLPFKVTQEIVIYFKEKDTRFSHDVLSCPNFVFYDKTVLGNFGLYGVPAVDERGIKIGGLFCGDEVHPEERLASKDTAERENNKRTIADIEAFVSEHLPHLQPRHHASETCLFSTTPNLDFIIDRVRLQNHSSEGGGEFEATVGGGFSGHGFKFGPLIGELLADRVLGDDKFTRKYEGTELFLLSRKGSSEDDGWATRLS